MKGRLDLHAKYRELLAARLDRPLTRAENRILVAHLKSCAGCRQVERDYRDQSALLRSLPARQPPRDLWARTSTALDREMSQRGFGYPRVGRRRVVRAARSGAPSALATVVAAVGVLVALVALQLPPFRQPPAGSGAPPDSAVAPTPFAVKSEPLSLVAAGHSDLTFYETQVDRVCPEAAPECYGDSKFVERRVSIPNMTRLQNATLSGAGRMAFVGHNNDRDVIAVVLLSTDATPPDRGNPTNQPTPTPLDTPVVPTDTPTSTRTPGTPLPSERPTARPTKTTVEPTPSEEPTTTTEPQVTDTPKPSADTEPSTLPTETPTPPSPTAPPPVAPASVDPLATAVAVEAKVVSILENVRSAGAPPAWSRDGEVLAFSAMPADGSQGPDVYVWQPGDAEARAITSDHSSFFASWSGRRVVISKLSVAEDAAADTPAKMRIATSVIDPVTAEERAVDGPQMWLPVVDPQRAHAIAWQGTLDTSVESPNLMAGALYIVNWTALNPFRVDDGAAPSEATPEAVMTPLDPTRDPATAPVLDWQARWSTDGRVLGIWEAETATDSWGNLMLMAVDQESGAVNTAEPLLPSRLAKRGFALGSDRVAWIGASEVGTAGELRIRTWGIDGVGGLQLRPGNTGELVPTY